MAGNVPDAGEHVPCPSCGQTVLQKAMIPVLQDGSKTYVCVECARRMIVAPAPADEPAPA